MKKAILICLIIFCSCNNKKTVQTKDPLTIKPAVLPVVDSIGTSVQEMLSNFDSALYYSNINHEYALEASENEALYYKTADEKYRKAFYRCQNKKIEAARKGAEFQKKLKDN